MKAKAKPRKPMTLKAWEGSPADERKDRAAAKKAGVPMKKWEGSKADRKLDKAAVKKANKRK